MTQSMPEQAGSSPAKISLLSLLPNLLAVILILAAILFIPAGRLDWLQARLFVIAFAGLRCLCSARPLPPGPRRVVNAF